MSTPHQPPAEVHAAIGANPESYRIELSLTIAFEQREDGWYSRMVIYPFISEWVGPYEDEAAAAGRWQKKLFALLHDRRV